MDEEQKRISPEHLQLLKQAFWTCYNWWFEDEIMIGDNQGFRFWLGNRGDEYIGTFMNKELDLQGDFSAHVARKLYPVAKARLEKTN